VYFNKDQSILQRWMDLLLQKLCCLCIKEDCTFGSLRMELDIYIYCAHQSKTKEQHMEMLNISWCWRKEFVGCILSPSLFNMFTWTRLMTVEPEQKRQFPVHSLLKCTKSPVMYNLRVLGSSSSKQTSTSCYCSFSKNEELSELWLLDGHQYSIHLIVVVQLRQLNHTQT